MKIFINSQTSTVTPFQPTHYNWCNYLSIRGLKLIHASKRGPSRLFTTSSNAGSISGVTGIILTHLHLHKIADILQTTFLEAFLLMRSIVSWWKFPWSLFQMVHRSITQLWFRYWLGVEYAPSHNLTNADPVHWRIYAALGGDELKRVLS